MFKNLFVVITCLAIPCLVFADTIYLKNGKQIKNVEVIEEDNAVKYYRAGQEVILPKDTVDRVEIIALEKAPPPTVNLESYKTAKDKEWELKMEKSEANMRAMGLSVPSKKSESTDDYDKDFVLNAKADIMAISDRNKACKHIYSKKSITLESTLIKLKYIESLLISLSVNPNDNESKRRYEDTRKEVRTLNATQDMLNEMEKLFCK